MLQHGRKNIKANKLPYGTYHIIIMYRNIKKCISMSTSLLSRVTTRILSGTRRELVLFNSVMSVHLTVNFVSLANM